MDELRSYVCYVVAKHEHRGISSQVMLGIDGVIAVMRSTCRTGFMSTMKTLPPSLTEGSSRQAGPVVLDYPQSPVYLVLKNVPGRLSSDLYPNVDGVSGERVSLRSSKIDGSGIVGLRFWKGDWLAGDGSVGHGTRDSAITRDENLIDRDFTLVFHPSTSFDHGPSIDDRREIILQPNHPLSLLLTCTRRTRSTAVGAEGEGGREGAMSDPGKPGGREDGLICSFSPSWPGRAGGLRAKNKAEEEGEAGWQSRVMMT